MTGMTNQSTEDQWNTIKTYRYVPHELVEKYTNEGWVISSLMEGSHHAQYSVIMEKPDNQ